MEIFAIPYSPLAIRPNKRFLDLPNPRHLAHVGERALVFISRALRRKAASATRDIAPPTLMRLTPAAESWSTVSVGSAKPLPD